MYDLAFGEAFPIEPQQVGQLLCIATIGLLLGWLFRVNQHDFAALPYTERSDQPVVEAANFENRHEIRIHLGELLEERFDLFRSSTDLSTELGVSIFVTNTNGDLLCVLVDCEVQHFGFLLSLASQRLRRVSESGETYFFSIQSPLS